MNENIQFVHIDVCYALNLANFTSKSGMFIRNQPYTIVQAFLENLVFYVQIQKSVTTKLTISHYTTLKKIKQTISYYHLWYPAVLHGIIWAWWISVPRNRWNLVELGYCFENCDSTFSQSLKSSFKMTVQKTQRTVITPVQFIKAWNSNVCAVFLSSLLCLQHKPDLLKLRRWLTW